MCEDDEILISDIKKTFLKDEGSFASLRDVFAGRSALIISAGPSAIKWRDVLSAIPNSNPLIICVKQAINLTDIDCHFHFLNNWNLQKYDCSKKPVSIMTVDHAAPSFGSYDINCFIDKKTDKTLASGLSFSDYDIGKTGKVRPKGPGIMYESVFYFLKFFGVTEIHTIGWDIADLNGQNKHYDDGAIDFEADSVMSESLKNYLKWARCLSLLSGLRSILSCPLEYYRYSTHKKCNKASMKNGEAALVSSSVIVLKKWLEDDGVSLHIHGGSTWM